MRRINGIIRGVVDGIPADCHSLDMSEFNAPRLTAKDITRDRNQPCRSRRNGRHSVNSDVGTTRLNRCLNGVAGDRDFADHSGRGLEPDFRPGRLAVLRLVDTRIVVVLDVVSRNLQIMNVAVE